MRRPWLLLCAAIACAVLTLLPAIRQDEQYHLFADHRTLLGIANFWNVVSNLPFLVVGLTGLRTARRLSEKSLFAGVLLTAFGSAYYHLAPGDARLVWDRLPMTLVFMSFVCCVLEEDRLVLPLAAIGTGSVIWWRLSNDLRFYGLIKFGPILVLLPILVRRRQLLTIVALFGLAQLCEFEDRALYSLLAISGHTVKHLVAGLATFVMLRWRQQMQTA